MEDKIISEFEILKEKLAKAGINISTSSVDDVIFHFEDALDKEYKKKHGVVYTPQWLADSMVYMSIDAWLKNITTIGIKDISNLESSESIKIIELIQNIKICDPCVGSGVFVMALINLMCSITQQLFFNLNRDFNRLDTILKIVKNNIYAIDIDNKAIEITKFRLWAYCCEQGYMGTLQEFASNLVIGDILKHNFEKLNINYDYDLSGVDNLTKELFIAEWQENWDTYKKSIGTSKETFRKVNLLNTALEVSHSITGNAIPYSYSIKILNNRVANKEFSWNIEFMNVFETNGGFDIVIGNPPYISNKANTAENESDDFSGIDIYAQFYIEMCKHLADKGILQFVTPINWCKNSNYIEFRQKIMNTKPLLVCAIEFRNRIQVFDNALATVGVYTLSNSDQTDISVCKLSERVDTMAKFLDFIDNNSKVIDRDKLDIAGGLILDSRAIDIKNKLSATFRTLGDVVGKDNIIGGFTNKESYNLDDIDVDTFRAIEIDNWGVMKPTLKLAMSPTRYDKHKDRFRSYFTIQMFSDDFECAYARDIFPSDATANILNNEPWIYALFNSKIASTIYKTLYYKTFTRSYARVTFLKNVTALQCFPIPNQLEELESIAKEYINISTSSMDSVEKQETLENIQTKLEETVRKLYRLSIEEVNYLKDAVGMI